MKGLWSCPILPSVRHLTKGSRSAPGAPSGVRMKVQEEAVRDRAVVRQSSFSNRELTDMQLR